MHQLPFQERYEFIQQLLRRSRAYIAASIMRLGHVQFTSAVETAAILATGSDVTLYFNPDFCERIDNLELAGVLVHESLHFVFRHQERVARVRSQHDRFLFGLACDAVINDLITAKFEELRLPDIAVTGEWLIGRNASSLAAEQVFRLLQSRVTSKPEEINRLSQGQTVDDHSAWDPQEAEIRERQTRWSDESNAVVRRLLAKGNVKDPCYSTIPLGEDRLTTPSRRCRKNLARFLLEAAQTETLYDTIWTRPNRKLLSVYPEVILPTYESAGFRNVLIAIDTSGSVPNGFISVAMNFARQKVPRTKITLISFDVNAYEAIPAATLLKGGGGTRAQAVEEYALQKLQHYPECVFVLTDGFTSPLQISKPERWTWLLPPWGSDGSVPKGSRVEFFETADL